MRREWIERLACPRTGAAYELDPVRVAGDEIVEAFLVSRDERDVRPVFAGVAVLPVDLREHLRSQGSVYRRSPLNDPRLVRFLLARAGSGHDVVPFDEVVAAYRDLARDPPPGYITTRPAGDLALRELLQGLDRPAPGARGLYVGCGVGRGVFDLCEYVDAALGVDSSVACVRRARNVAVTREDFFLPAPKGSGLKEIPLGLAGLRRDGADFAVADAAALPLRDGVIERVVLAAGERGVPWEDPGTVLGEALRVLAPGGWLLWHESLSEAPQATREAGPWRAARPA